MIFRKRDFSSLVKEGDCTSLSVDTGSRVVLLAVDNVPVPLATFLLAGVTALEVGRTALLEAVTFFDADTTSLDAGVTALEEVVTFFEAGVTALLEATTPLEAGVTCFDTTVLPEETTSLLAGDTAFEDFTTFLLAGETPLEETVPTFLLAGVTDFELVLIGWNPFGSKTQICTDYVILQNRITYKPAYTLNPTRVETLILRLITYFI